MSSSYPSDWDSRRKKVYKRDNHTCQNCKRKGGTVNGVELHAHHVVPVSKNGSHDLTNLITVCADCHNAIHGNSMAPENPSIYNRLLSHSRITPRELPRFENCPNCGTQNDDESVEVSYSNEVLGNYTGFILGCDACNVRMLSVRRPRWRMEIGRTELQGVSLDQNQWEKIGRALREEENPEKKIKDIIDKNRLTRSNTKSVDELEEVSVFAGVLVLSGILSILGGVFAGSIWLGVIGVGLLIAGPVIQS